MSDIKQIAKRMIHSHNKEMENTLQILESDYGIKPKTDNDMDNKQHLLLNFISQYEAMFDDIYNPYHQERVRRVNEEHRKRKKANIKRIAEINNKRFGERALSKFVIKGHEIEAHSRKDAIIRLRHKGLL